MMTIPAVDISEVFSKALDDSRGRSQYRSILNGVAILACSGIAIYFMKWRISTSRHASRDTMNPMAIQ